MAIEFIPLCPKLGLANEGFHVVPNLPFLARIKILLS